MPQVVIDDSPGSGRTELHDGSIHVEIRSLVGNVQSLAASMEEVRSMCRSLCEHASVPQQARLLHSNSSRLQRGCSNPFRSQGRAPQASQPSGRVRKDGTRSLQASEAEANPRSASAMALSSPTKLAFPSEGAVTAHTGEVVHDRSAVSFDESPKRTLSDLSDVLQKAAAVDTWPANIPLRSEIMMTKESSAGSMQRRPTLSRSSSSDMVLRKKNRGALEGNDRLHRKGSGQLDVCAWGIRPLRPSSPIYLGFQCASIIILFWDCLTIPFRLAWDIEPSTMIATTSWISTLFWTADLFLNFLVGYYRDGDMRLRFREIARHYLSGWFIPDLTVVVADWLSILLGDNKGRFKLFRLFKVMRALRVLAVVRLAKLWRVVEDWIHHSLSENSRLLIRICWLCSLVLFINHVIACMWFGVGRQADSDTDISWIDYRLENFNGAELVPFINTPVSFQYTTALHWAIAQLTLGANEITSTNTYERIMQVTCLLLGLVCGSTFISSLSAAIFDYHAQQEDVKRSLRNLRRYLRQHNVESRTAFAVQRQVIARLAKAEHITEEEVEALNLLRPETRAELDYVINRATVLTHPLLTIWVLIDVKSVWRICSSGSTLRLLPDEELFDAGDSASSIYYYVKGKLLYTQEPDSALEDSRYESYVKEHSWLSEAALWVEWQHVGAADCLVESELWELKVASFLQVLEQHPAVHQMSSDYGRQLHLRLQNARPPLHSYPSDLHIPGSELHDLAFTMSKDARTTLSLMMLENFRQNRQVSDYRNLRLNAIAGRSLVMQHGGETAEVLASVVLRIRVDHDQDVWLTELGRTSGDQNKRIEINARTLEYPRELGETSDERMKRAELEDLHDMSGALVWSRSYSLPPTLEHKTANNPVLHARTVYEGRLDISGLRVLEVELSEAEQQRFTISPTPSGAKSTTTGYLSSQSRKDIGPAVTFSTHQTPSRPETLQVFLQTASDAKVIVYAAMPKEHLDAVCTDKHLQRVLREKLAQLPSMHLTVEHSIAEVTTPAQTFAQQLSDDRDDAVMSPAVISEADETLVEF